MNRVFKKLFILFNVYSDHFACVAWLDCRNKWKSNRTYVAVYEYSQQSTGLFHAHTLVRVVNHIDPYLCWLHQGIHSCNFANRESMGQKCDILCTLDWVCGNGDVLLSCCHISTWIWTLGNRWTRLSASFALAGRNILYFFCSRVMDHSRVRAVCWKNLFTTFLAISDNQWHLIFNYRLVFS